MYLGPVGHWFGDFLVVGFCHAAGDAGQGVRVAAQRHGFADGVFEVFRVKKTNERLWDSSLATGFPVVDGMPKLVCLVEVVTVSIFYILSDFFFGLSVPGHPDSGCSSLGALDSLRMVVGDGGRYCRYALGLLQGIKEPAHSAHTHRGAVAPGAIRMSACLGFVWGVPVPVIISV